MSLRTIVTTALDFVYPPRCLACGHDVDRMGGVCAACWKRLTFIADPLCACCGLPFDYDPGPGSLCGACMGDAPLFDRARAALAYDDGSRSMLVGLKHNRLHNVATLATWMARSGEALIQDADLICAVPLHRWRLLKRGYNQASLLASGIARGTNSKAIPDLLRRDRRTISQGGLSRSGRQRNVRGAFSVSPRWRSRIQGKRILLIDDVFTTGATIGECCRVLKRAGAAQVDVLCAARVIK